MAFPPNFTGNDGTQVINKAYLDAYDAEVSSALVDAGNPTVTPAQTTAEVIAARGNLSDLNTRMSAIVDVDGNPVGVVSPAMLRNGFALGNLVRNDSFLMWSRGDAAAPDGWTLSGAGAAVARCGVGLGDTTVISGQDHFSAKVTYGSATAKLTQELMSAGMAAKLGAFLTGRQRPSLDGGNSFYSGYESGEVNLQLYGFAHVRSTTTGIARISVYDNATEEFSPYHDGNTALYPFKTLIAGPLDCSSIAGAVGIRGNVGGAGSAYFQGFGAFLTPLGLPPMYLPGIWRYRERSYYLSGNQSTGDKDIWQPARPVHILGVTLTALTAPTVSAVKYDLQTPIVAAWSSLFSTLPQIAATKFTGLQACDGTYRRRTIRGVYAADAASLPDNCALKLRCDTDDGGNTSADVVVTIHFVEQASPLDQFRAMTDIGE